VKKLIIIMLLISAAYPAYAETDKSQYATIAVEGNNSGYFEKDIVNLSGTIKLEKLEVNIDTAKKKTLSTKKELQTYIESLTIKNSKLDITSIEMSEDRRIKNNDQKNYEIAGYGSEITFKFKMPVKEISKIEGIITHLDAKHENILFNGLTFSNSDSLYKENSKKCFEKAFLNSKEKAKQIMQSSGKSELELISFGENKNLLREALTAGDFGSDGYDSWGYDKNGYDKDGYDKDGYDKDGYDKYGFSRNGYDRYGEVKKGWFRDEISIETFSIEELNNISIIEETKQKIPRNRFSCKVFSIWRAK
jgi:hypothetical protein